MAGHGSLAESADRCRLGAPARSWRLAGLSRLSWPDLAVQAAPLLFFFLLGVGLYHQTLTPDYPPQHLARLPLNQELVLSGRLYRPTRVGAEGVRLYLAVEGWKGPAGWRAVTGRLQVTAPPLTAPPVGARLFVRGKLREPQALLNPGTLDRPRQLAAEGICRQMHLQEAGHLIFPAGDQAPSLAEHLRGGIRTLLKALPPDAEAMNLSMLLGDQGKVSQQMRQRLSRTGTSHLLVINGMHLGAVAAVTFFLVFWLLRLFPWVLLRVNAVKAATLAAALPVVGYAHLAGGSPSTQRAEVMVLAYLLLMFLGRSREVWSALALAALWIMVWSPLLLFSVSFQLSFAAVSGIVYLVPQLMDLASRYGPFRDPDLSLRSRPSGGLTSGWGLHRAGWRGLELLAVSLAAALATTPLVAHHFQVVSVFGFLVNLAAIPLVLMVALPLGELAVLAQGLSLPALAGILLAVGKIPLTWGYGLITWVAALPGSGVTVPTPSWLQVALIYGVIFCLLPVRRCIWTWAGAGLGMAILAATLAWPVWPNSPRGEITLLDSRTGLDAVLVAPEGQSLVVTAAFEVWPGWEGGGYGPLAGYLHWRQFSRLAGVVALNLNPRNAHGALSLAQQFDIGGFWWRGPRPAGKVIDLINLLGDRGQTALALDKMNPPQHLGRMALTYLFWDGGRGAALQVSCQGSQALLLPPLKRTLEESLPWPEDSPLAVLVAAEGDASAAAAAARLKPEQVILYGSRGPGGGDAGLSPPAWLTRNGAVTVTFSGKKTSLEQWRP